MTEHAIRNLFRMITDDQRNLDARLESASLLSTMPDCDDACVSLLDVLPPTSLVGRSYREVLVTSGASTDALCVMLWEPSRPLQRAAVQRLGELGDPSALPDLISLLGHQLASTERRDRELLLMSLDALGSCWVPGAVDAPLAVAEAVGDQDSTVRTVACATLRRMGADAVRASDRLLQLLSSDNQQIRFTVAELLPELTPPDTYVPWMVRLLRDESDELIRWVARYELSRLPCPTPDVQAALAA